MGERDVEEEEAAVEDQGREEDTMGEGGMIDFEAREDRG